jgi:predicted nucleic acid-binding protein
LPVYFFDTSALVKRYVNEIGSSWVDRVSDPVTRNEIYIVRITEVETTAAAVRRQRGGTLSASDTATVLSQFRRDIANEYRVIEVDRMLLSTAASLAEKHGLRAYDAVQLAAALEVNVRCLNLSLDPLTVVSADGELNAAATAEGLAVENPNTHP